MSYPFSLQAPAALELHPRPARIARCAEQGSFLSIVRRGHLREFHITIQPLPGESVVSMVQRLHALVAAHQAKIVRQEVFGQKSSATDLLLATAATFRALDWPITWAEAVSCEPHPMSGIHALALARTEVETLSDRTPVGTVFSDGYARYCLLGAITPKNTAATEADQAREVFDQITENLAGAGMEMTHLARTWFYLHQIDRWYAQFNQVRSERFEWLNLFSQQVPASTGIGARNLANAALVAGAWAVQATDPRVSVSVVESPIQCSARNYGSSFSRAVEISTPDLRRLFISGTASIAPDGSSRHHGNIQRQIALTMEVVHQILRARQMDWQHSTRATVYLKSSRDAAAWTQYEIEYGLRLPVLVTEAEICRPELLFEIELDALAPNTRSI